MLAACVKEPPEEPPTEQPPTEEPPPEEPPPEELPPPARRLWTLLREQMAKAPSVEQDDQRLARVLAERQTRSQAFFSSSAGKWDKLRRERK